MKGFANQNRMTVRLARFTSPRPLDVRFSLEVAVPWAVARAHLARGICGGEVCAVSVVDALRVYGQVWTMNMYSK